MNLTIPAASDYHVHLRQGDMMAAVAPHTASQCGRALLMPNTTPPVAAAEDVERYRQEAVRALGPDCDPVMTVKLLPATTPETIRAAMGAGAVAAKLYPEGVTTNAHDGVPGDWLAQNPKDAEGAGRFRDCLKEMERVGMVLCCHGEMPGHRTFICSDRSWPETDRIGGFVPFLTSVVATHPRLRVVLEHVTTAPEVDFVRAWRHRGRTVAATITPHHLTTTLEDIVGGMLKPHLFCKPVPKFEEDRLALVAAATSGEPCFFLGSDSAPHLKGKKEAKECCAGVFNAPVLLPVLAEVFEAAGNLGHLANFTSRDGDMFYGLPPTGREVTLVKEDWQVPDSYDTPDGPVVPFRSGETLRWRVAT